MRKFILIFFACNLLTPVYAQFKNIPGAAKKIRAGYLLPRLSVSRWSKQANVALDRKISQIPVLTSHTITNIPRKGHPHSFTFQVQYTEGPNQETASAFAIKLRGKIWGVTAGHVMRNISLRPHMKVQIAPNSFSITPIKTFFIGNPRGMDIALFEIPAKELPYLTVLQPAKHTFSIGEKIKVSGFSKGQALSLSGEKVLFSTPLKLFIQKTSSQDLKGFCGSPILLEGGRVGAVYSGFADAKILTQHAWFINLPLPAQKAMSNLHFAVPVEVLELMAKGIEEDGSLLKSGTMMKVFDHSVALLHPNEYILSVEQFRNGEKIAKIHKNPLIDPGKLEQFFELQENDILRIYINRPQTPQTRTAYAAYDVNVSSGEVTELSEKDLFGPIDE